MKDSKIPKLLNDAKPYPEAAANWMLASAERSVAVQTASSVQVDGGEQP